MYKRGGINELFNRLQVFSSEDVQVLKIRDEECV